MNQIPHYPFDQLVWSDGHVALGDLKLQLQQAAGTHAGGGDDLVFYKTQNLVQQYQDFSRKLPKRPLRNLLELGIWDGGSVAFWNEILKPGRHVAIDLRNRVDPPPLQRYLAGKQVAQRVKTVWNFDQSDQPRLRDLVHTEFEQGLDLVLDDASHLYAPTLASFEALFPLMPPGGIYIIEDWAWEHWQGFDAPNHPWAGEVPLTELVLRLIAATGTPTELIGSVAVYQGFVAIERGPKVVTDPQRFRLEDQIRTRRPENAPRPWIARLRAAVRRIAKKIVRRT